MEHFTICAILHQLCCYLCFPITNLLVEIIPKLPYKGTSHYKINIMILFTWKQSVRNKIKTYKILPNLTTLGNNNRLLSSMLVVDVSSEQRGRGYVDGLTQRSRSHSTQSKQALVLAVRSPADNTWLNMETPLRNRLVIHVLRKLRTFWFVK